MVEDAASAWPAVGSCGGVWPKASSPGAAAVVVEGLSKLRVCGFMVEPCGCFSSCFPISVTRGGDMLLHVVAVSGLGCQLLFPERLGHLRRLPRGFDLDFLRLLEVKVYLYPP